MILKGEPMSIAREGYLTIPSLLDPVTIRQFWLFARNSANIHRGNAVDGKYYSEHDGEREYDVWWTKQPPREMWQPIVEQLASPISVFFGDKEWDIHCVDCITTRPKSSKVYAHIDLPYRYDEFWNVDRTLGVQIIIPLDDFTLENGATIYLPSSHLMRVDPQTFEEKRDELTDMLLNQGVQNVSKAGSVLMYDGRILHSTMPNHSDQFRSALLINVMEKDIIPRVQELDGNTDYVKT